MKNTKKTYVPYLFPGRKLWHWRQGWGEGGRGIPKIPKTSTKKLNYLKIIKNTILYILCIYTFYIFCIFYIIFGPRSEPYTVSTPALIVSWVGPFCYTLCTTRHYTLCPTRRMLHDVIIWYIFNLFLHFSFS